MKNDRELLLQKHDRELLLQKHNNVHKTLCGLFISWTIAPVLTTLKHKEIVSLLESEFWLLVKMVILLLTAYVIIIMFFYYKVNEYEHLIEFHSHKVEDQPDGQPKD